MLRSTLRRSSFIAIFFPSSQPLRRPYAFSRASGYCDDKSSCRERKYRNIRRRNIFSGTPNLISKFRVAAKVFGRPTNPVRGINRNTLQIYRRCIRYFITRRIRSRRIQHAQQYQKINLLLHLDAELRSSLISTPWRKDSKTLQMKFFFENPKPRLRIPSRRHRFFLETISILSAE